MKKLLLFLMVVASLAVAQPRKKKVLAIGAVAGYQHDSVSNSLATIWNIGHDTGLWDT